MIPFFYFLEIQELVSFLTFTSGLFILLMKDGVVNSVFFFCIDVSRQCSLETFILFQGSSKSSFSNLKAECLEHYKY